MTTAEYPDFCNDSVRSNDQDRFVLAMLAPPSVRDELLALFAFNVEISRTRELVSEPPLGEIRLQWWRDGLDAIYAGNDLAHGIGPSLAETIAAFDLTKALFDRLIDARGSDLDDSPPDTIEALLHYAEETVAPLLCLSLEVVGERSEAAQKAAGHIGTAWSLVGLMRALPFHLLSRRQYLPRELLQRHGVLERDLLEIKPSDSLNHAIEELCGLVDQHVRSARAISREMGTHARPVLRQIGLTEMYRKRLSRVGYNPFDPRIAQPLPMMVWRLLFRKMTGRY